MHKSKYKHNQSVHAGRRYLVETQMRALRRMFCVRTHAAGLIRSNSCIAAPSKDVTVIACARTSSARSNTLFRGVARSENTRTTQPATKQQAHSAPIIPAYQTWAASRPRRGCRCRTLAGWCARGGSLRPARPRTETGSPSAPASNRYSLRPSRHPASRAERGTKDAPNEIREQQFEQSTLLLGHARRRRALVRQHVTKRNKTRAGAPGRRRGAAKRQHEQASKFRRQLDPTCKRGIMQ